MEHIKEHLRTVSQIKDLQISYSIQSQRFHDEALNTAIEKILRNDIVGLRVCLATFREIYSTVATLNESYPILPSFTPDVDAPAEEIVEGFLPPIKRMHWGDVETLYDKLRIVVVTISECIDDDGWKFIPSYLHIFRVVLDRIEELEKGDK